MSKVDYLAQVAVVELLSTMFGFAYLDPETLRDNIRMGSKGKLSRRDRSIDKKLADYLLENFAYIFAGLIGNEGFRNVFMEAVSSELVLEDRDEVFVQGLRAEMNAGKEPDSGEVYILDFSKYDDPIYRRINGILAESFDQLKAHSGWIDELVRGLSEDDVIDIGFCISNFVFLVRAFSQNGLFTQYVKSVIERVKPILLLKGENV